MIPALRRPLHGLAVLAILLSWSAIGCERTPLLAPAGSTITLISSTSTLALNGSSTLTAQVLEPAGTAPHSGTTVTFTTNLGTIQPVEAETDVNGQATVKFLAGTTSGVATILASSGGATVATANAVKISIGAAAVGQLTLSADPGSVSSFGGTSTITATVVDTGGNTLAGVPVNFTSDFGTISPGSVTTDASGKAQATLTTTVTAKVTATAGVASTSGTTTTAAQTATTTVSVTASPTLVITPPTTASAGLPASFSFAVTVPTNGSAVRDLTVNWGDGSSQSLGAVTGTASASHVFKSAGSYLVTGTVTDASGTRTDVSTSVTVTAVPRPAIVITFSQTNIATHTVTFSIQVTTVSGLGVVDTVIDFGDGTSSDLGGATSTTVPHTYVSGGAFTVQVTVTDTTGQKTTGTTFISVS